MVKTDLNIHCLIRLKVVLILLFIIDCICSHSACVSAREHLYVCKGKFGIV